jgi:flagellar FliL protein
VPEKTVKVQEKKNKKSPKVMKIVLAVLIFVLVSGGSAAGAFFYFKKSAGVPENKMVEYETLELGDMVVNLAQATGVHYLRVRMTLEYHPNKELAAEIERKKHQVSDVLLATLRNKSLADVIPAGSAETLKADLLEAINGCLEHGKVEGIYFTDYLVQ